MWPRTPGLRGPGPQRRLWPQLWRIGSEMRWVWPQLRRVRSGGLCVLRSRGSWKKRTVEKPTWNIKPWISNWLGVFLCVLLCVCPYFCLCLLVLLITIKQINKLGKPFYTKENLFKFIQEFNYFNFWGIFIRPIVSFPESLIIIFYRGFYSNEVSSQCILFIWNHITIKG